jgi:hypothetical protein
MPLVLGEVAFRSHGNSIDDLPSLHYDEIYPNVKNSPDPKYYCVIFSILNNPTNPSGDGL